MNLGAHVSIAGGIHLAVDRQREIGGTCGQLFTTSPQVWRRPEIDPRSAAEFRSGSDDALRGPWVIHATYLVNLATPKAELRDRSIDRLQADLDAAERLGIEYVNVHLGAHTGAGVDAGLANAVDAIEALSIPDEVTLLLESDAGAGTKLGGDLEHMAAVRTRTTRSVGVCLDTAHLFAAGYDLSTPAGVERLVERVDATVGLEAVRCVHLNDSRHACGSHRDRHAHIGDGRIGLDGLRAVVNHEALRDRPFVLETPKDGIGDPGNIERVKALRD